MPRLFPLCALSAVLSLVTVDWVVPAAAQSAYWNGFDDGINGAAPAMTPPGGPYEQRFYDGQGAGLALDQIQQDFDRMMEQEVTIRWRSCAFCTAADIFQRHWAGAGAIPERPDKPLPCNIAKIAAIAWHDGVTLGGRGRGWLQIRCKYQRKQRRRRRRPTPGRIVTRVAPDAR